jgi:hypothetical protein
MISTRMVVVLLALSLLVGCVVPEEGGSGGGTGKSSSAGKGKSGGSIVVCGESFTLGDLLEHPMFRQSFKQFITLQQLYAEASKAGINVTDEELTKEVDKQKEQITSSGQSWEEFLKMQGMTEDEVKQMVKTQKLFEKLLDNKLNLTEENMRKYFDENKEQVLTAHIQSNFLPESERPNLKYEDCIDAIKEGIRSRDGYQYQQELMDELTLNATLDLSGALPADQATAIQEAILGGEQTKIKERQAEEAKAKAGTDGTAGEGAVPAPTTGAGGTETPSAPEGEGAKEGKEPAAPAPTETK